MKWVSALTALLIFSAAAVGFWVLGQWIPSWAVQQADQAGILLGYLLGCLTIALAPLAWIKRQDIRRWLIRRKFESVGLAFEIPEERVKAVVIPVSRREQPEWILRWLRPRHVSFLYTVQSRQTAQDLAVQFGGGAEAVAFFPDKDAISKGEFQLSDAYDPRESKKTVKLFLQVFLDRLDLRPEEVFVDTTGGTVPMSVGAFQAAEEIGVSSIYVRGAVGGKIEKPGRREQGAPIYISDRTREAPSREA